MGQLKVRFKIRQNYSKWIAEWCRTTQYQKCDCGRAVAFFGIFKVLSALTP
jgi:hypothetical protein